ncbi:hypothetical protein PUNSTDRAFT_50156 [Punctularia strigosozonata HHB-11173 SS5]|uniref:uncharacterized protein n=1 Tax=Punctularia strigosozonata (strain HHB-11173) TaxID=741275 RepID=UPI000441765F|nr:uncharacterized protein PUNSTDRAFT_50156 [Punctularia strigosozonata HHB-11173 SS5]EIN12942.1 hypothetical protein PUNSTDRAFT_50156 [Punctularia strigosozonata HHB-11173 SS5]
MATILDVSIAVASGLVSQRAREDAAREPQPPTRLPRKVRFQTASFISSSTTTGSGGETTILAPITPLRLWKRRSVETTAKDMSSRPLDGPLLDATMLIPTTPLRIRPKIPHTPRGPPSDGGVPSSTMLPQCSGMNRNAGVDGMLICAHMLTIEAMINEAIAEASLSPSYV